MKNVLRVVVVLAEFFLFGNGLLMSWLIGAWMVDDSFAFRASEADWWKVAGARFLFLTVASVAIAGVVCIVNKSLFAWCGFGDRRTPRLSAMIVGIGLFVAGLAGVIEFLIDRPYF